MAEPIATVGYLAGICGSEDGTDWEKVLIDASRRLVVAVAALSGTVEVVQDTPGDLLTGQHQYDGSAWHKSNMLWGFYGTTAESLSNLNLSAGTNYIDSAAVPEGEVWVLSAMGARVNSATCTLLSIGMMIGAVSVATYYAVPPTSGTRYNTTGRFVLGEEDYLRLTLLGCTAGDDGYLWYGGYKMKLDM